MISICFNIVFKSTDALNFATGEFAMLGGMVAISLYGVKIPLWACFFLSIGIVTLVAIIFERTTIHYQMEKQVMYLIILTIGGSIFLKGGAMIIWGKDPLPLPSFSGDEPIRFFNAVLVPQTLWIIGIGTTVSMGIQLFFRFTLTGKAMRACSFDRLAAKLVGINDSWMVLVSFALAAAMGSMAGIVIAPITFMAYDHGDIFVLKGFCATFLGGIGNLYGSIVGGILLGILESLGAGLVSSSYKDAIAFVILLAVLFVKPSGILGQEIKEKV